MLQINKSPVCSTWRPSSAKSSNITWQTAILNTFPDHLHQLFISKEQFQCGLKMPSSCKHTTSENVGLESIKLGRTGWSTKRVTNDLPEISVDRCCCSRSVVVVVTSSSICRRCCRRRPSSCLTACRPVAILSTLSSFPRSPMSSLGLVLAALGRLRSPWTGLRADREDMTLDRL